MPSIAVVLCTFNPDRALLKQVLDALASQTVKFQLLIVDNNSDPPVEIDSKLAACLDVRVLHERRQGLSFARVRGISETTAPFVCFVDDDNLLQAQYLENALEIGALNPQLGAFGGKACGVFDRRPDWLVRRHIARYAVRDNGPHPITGPGDRWGLWEPFGAGLIVRADVARAFAELIDASEDAGGLGRTRAELGSGEDSLFSRIAHRLGYQVAYRPELVLDHIISSNRLNWRYLFRLIAGQARAQFVLNRICGGPEPAAPPPRWREPDLNIRRFIARIRNPGLFEAITHVAWDHSFWNAQRQPETRGQRQLKDAFTRLEPVDRDDNKPEQA